MTQSKRRELSLHVSRVRETYNFQPQPYHNLTLDVSLDVREYDGNELTAPEMVAEGVEAIQTGFGLALLMIFKRYNENMQDAEVQAYLNALIPPTLKIVIKDNDIIMDSLMLAARKMLEKK